jgi:kynurenine formamidase
MLPSNQQTDNHRSGRSAVRTRLPHTAIMPTIDLSHPLDASTPAYPGIPKFCCTPLLTLESHGCAVSALTLSSHTGTHIDAPAHFVAGGKCVDEIDLSVLVGPAVVVDLTAKTAHAPIEAADLAPALERAPQILLLRTGWSRHWPAFDAYATNPYLTVEAAQAVVDAGVRVLGVDTLSPDAVGSTDFAAHHILLGAGCIIAENLTNLDALPDDMDGWIVNLVPLRLAGCDGSPIRAFAWHQ